MRSIDLSGKWITFLRELITEDRDAKLQPSIRIKTSVGGKHEKIALRRSMMGAFHGLWPTSKIQEKRVQIHLPTWIYVYIHI